jgi:hypothetical protein
VILAWREDRGRSWRAAAKRACVMGREVDDILGLTVVWYSMV